MHSMIRASLLFKDDGPVTKSLCSLMMTLNARYKGSIKTVSFNFVYYFSSTSTVQCLAGWKTSKGCPLSFGGY